MDDIEIPQRITGVEVRLACLQSATVLAELHNHDLQTLLSIAHVLHDWVDPASVDRVSVLVD